MRSPPPPPYREKMSTDLAYLAGVIDGEGTVTLTKNNKRDPFRRISVSVSNTDLDLIEWLHAEFGGKVRIRARQKAHYKVAYEWRIESDQALNLLKRVTKYLRVRSRKQRAEFICANWAKVTKRNGHYSENEKVDKWAFEFAVLSI
jgi:hypothetical protein